MRRARIHTQKYVIVIAFPRQQWLLERVLILRYLYIACIVLTFVIIITIFIAV